MNVLDALVEWTYLTSRPAPYEDADIDIDIDSILAESEDDGEHEGVQDQSLIIAYSNPDPSCGDADGTMMPW